MIFKTTFIKSTSFVLFVLFCNASFAREKLLMSGCSWDKVVIVDKKTGKTEWTHQLQKGDDCNDVEITKAGNVLYAYKGGARLVTKSQNILWDFKVEKEQGALYSHRTSDRRIPPGRLCQPITHHHPQCKR